MFGKNFTDATVGVKLIASIAILSSLLIPTMSHAQGYITSPGEKYYIDDQGYNFTGNINTSPYQNLTWTDFSPAYGINWGVEWNFDNAHDNLKYPSAHMGWHWGYPTGYDHSATGLPVQLNANKKIDLNWSFEVSNVATGTNENHTWYDVAWDCWFHWNSNPTWQNGPDFELMIWNKYASTPIGSKLETVELPAGSGIKYDVWGGWNTWYVFSFLRQNQSTNVQCNLKDFTDEAARIAPSIPYCGFNKWVYLTGIEAGIEEYGGKGYLKNWWYSSDVR